MVLKRYQREEEFRREGAGDDHKMPCKIKLDILIEQRKDLGDAIDLMLNDIATGEKKMKVYKQMKMYNDESLNPILYKKNDREEK